MPQPKKYFKGKSGNYTCPHCKMEFVFSQQVSHHCKVFHPTTCKKYNKQRKKPAPKTIKINIHTSVIQVYDFKNTKPIVLHF